MVYPSFSAKEAMKVATSRGTRVNNVAWQPGSRDLLACATSEGGKILDMEHGETEAVQLGTGNTTWVAWSPDGDLLVTVGEENIVWKSNGTRVATLLGQLGPVQANPWSKPIQAKFNARGSMVAVTALNCNVNVFNTVTGELHQAFEKLDELEFFCSSSGLNIPMVMAQVVTTMDFNPEKNILATGGHDGTVQLWDSGIMTTLNGHTRQVLEVLWINESGILASYSLDGQVRIWDAMSKTNLHIYEGFNLSVSNGSGVSFSPDGRFFAAGSRAQNVKVVKVNTGETVAEFQENGEGVSWRPGSNKIAVVTLGGEARVYNLENVMGINLKTMTMKCVASLFEKNLTKDKAEKFLVKEKIPKALVKGVCMHLN